MKNYWKDKMYTIKGGCAWIHAGKGDWYGGSNSNIVGRGRIGCL